LKILLRNIKSDKARRWDSGEISREERIASRVKFLNEGIRWRAMARKKLTGRFSKLRVVGQAVDQIGEQYSRMGRTQP
jgi:hypothetical protein